MKVINYILALLGFLFLNFSGLAAGSLWTDPGVNSVWYDTIQKAPWTPPGFIFGLAWTTIMVCFSFFMTKLYFRKESKYNNILMVSWLFNILWNPLFFTIHWLWLSVVVITTLTFIIGKLLHDVRKEGGYGWLLILPYFVWLNIAVSLNLFVALMN